MSGQILIVDDSSRDRDLALDVLAKSGFDLEVVCVHDGEEALDYLLRRRDFRLRRAEAPSLILLDIKMPKLDGVEVLRHLRGHQELTKIPVFMVSSSRQEQDILAAYDLKADGYLIKPLSQQQLEAAIEVARKR
ncbi:MAG TPA: response regulator [Thermoanaerobaculia bacterium]|nr:response regulator [Thermoanaerobaculia bacterium]